MVKNISLEINTGDNGNSNGSVKVDGFLENFIVRSTKPFNITIKLKDTGILLFDKRSCPSEGIWSLRSIASAWNGEVIPQSFTKYALKDELEVEISGATNSNIKLVFTVT